MEPPRVIPDLHDWLRVFLLPGSLTEATELLTLASSCATYLELYRQCFPAQFARSMQQHQSQDLLPLPQDAYSVPEWHFLKLVDTHLFPLPCWVFEERDAERRCYEVPIEPQGLLSPYEYGSLEEAVRDMDLGWQLLYFLGGRIEEAFFDDIFDEQDPARGIFTLERISGKLERAVLTTRCAACAEPLCFLRQAIAMLDRDTGIVWLDATYEMPVDDASWGRETLEALAAQYVEAREIEQQVTRFLRWLEADVLPHYTEVSTLWNHCLLESHIQSPA